MLAFVDPSSSDHHAGWLLRNVLAFVTHCLRQCMQSTRRNLLVLSYRQDSRKKSVAASRLFDVLLPESSAIVEAPELHRSFFERHLDTHKLSPRLVNLSTSMDPLRLIESAADLNLKLMRWRQTPSLNLERVRGTRCLLIGAGTLGCHVARQLVVRCHSGVL